MNNKIMRERERWLKVSRESRYMDLFGKLT